MWICGSCMFLRWSPHFHLLNVSWIRETQRNLRLMSCLSGCFFGCCFTVENGSKTEESKRLACRVPFSLFPPLCMPHFPINDVVSGAAFNWAVEVPDFRSTIPAFLTTRFWSLHCFMNACQRGILMEFPHLSPTPGGAFIHTRFIELAARGRWRYWFCVFTNVS